MQYIFIGLIFTTFDLSFTLGAIRIGLIPDFIGYVLIWCGAHKMKTASWGFQRLIPLCKALLVYSLIRYGTELLGIWTYISGLAYLIGALEMALSLYLIYLLVRATEALEAISGAGLESGSLRASWSALLVCSMLRQLFLPSALLGTIGVFACLIAGLVFLVRFARTKNRWLDRAVKG